MDDYDPDSLDVSAARNRILALTSAVTGTERIAVQDATGRILADDVTAPMDVPGFRNSAMDGYAFCYADASKSNHFKVVGTSLAGHPYTGTMQSHQCVKITTGAQIPDQADTVVMQENTQPVGEQDTKPEIEISIVPERGSNVRARGSNIKRQSILVGQHTRLGPAELGLLASVGMLEISVLRKLNIACFSTGDELVPPGNTLGPGMIHDSNRFMLISLLQDPAIQVIDKGILNDNPDDLRSCLGQIANADLAISSGGVSVGEADFVKQVLSEFGTVNFWKIAMKPGRPLTHAVLDTGTQFFGLPGNPVSGIVTFHLFVKPAIDAMLGQIFHPPFVQKAILTDKLFKLPGRVEMQRGILSHNGDEGWQVATTGLQDSHVLTSMNRANCYIVLDIASAGADAGEEVETLPFLNF